MALLSVVQSLLGVCHPLHKRHPFLMQPAFLGQHHQSDNPPRLPHGEQKKQPGTRRVRKLMEDLAAHLVFLALELLLQVKFLSLQITDGLP